MHIAICNDFEGLHSLVTVVEVVVVVEGAPLASFDRGELGLTAGALAALVFLLFTAQ